MPPLRRLLICLVLMLAFTACTDEVKFEKTKKRAEAGDIEAQSRLGHLYAYAEGVSVDFVESVKWFRKAAEQGHVDAQFRLACHYREGRGVPKNDAEAAKWFRNAAEQGEWKAQAALGKMYFEGKGVPRDYVEAYAWFNVQAVQGGGGRFDRDSVDELLTPEARAQAQQRSTQLFNEIEKNKKKAGK
jgi:TPR repeat protein